MTLNQKIERAKKLIIETVEKYPKYAVSFSGGKDSAVLYHLAYKALGDTHPKAFAVLSNTEFHETEEYVEEMMRFGITYRYTNGDDPADCCRSEKVRKFKMAVNGLDCWLSGIRADEGITRANFQEVEEKDGLVKVNPLLHFTEKDIWRYLAINHIRVNPKYKDGYRSLSCANCSVVEQDGDEPERAGRWKGTENACMECGIHTQSLRK
jgi:phosphoadenosine phosphosulfate reductase